MEDAFDADFSQVRVHLGPEAKRLGALAFAGDQDLYISPELYQPHTAAGRRLVAHELAHVVQQRAGRVRNPFGSGWAVVRDPGLEAEAERLSLQAARSPRMPSPRPDLRKPTQEAARTSPRISATVQARPDPRLASFAPHVRAAIQRGRNAPSASPRTAKTGCGCLCGGACRKSSGVVQRNGPGFQEPYEFLPDGWNALNVAGLSTARGLGFYTTPPIRGWQDPFLPEFVRQRPKKFHFGEGRSRTFYRYSKSTLLQDLKPRWQTQNAYVRALAKLHELGVSADDLVEFAQYGDPKAKQRIIEHLKSSGRLDELSQLETARREGAKRRFVFQRDPRSKWRYKVKRPAVVDVQRSVEDLWSLIDRHDLNPKTKYDMLSKHLKTMASSDAIRNKQVERLIQKVLEGRQVDPKLYQSLVTRHPKVPSWGLDSEDLDEAIKFIKLYGEKGHLTGAPVVSMTSSRNFSTDPDVQNVLYGDEAVFRDRYKVILEAPDGSYVETNLLLADERIPEALGGDDYFIKESEVLGVEDMSKHVSKVELNERSGKGMKYSTKLRLAGGALTALDWGSVAYRIGSADPRTRHLVIGEELGGQIGGWGGSALGTLVCILAGIASGGVGLFVCGFVGGMALGIGGSYVGHHLADQFFTVAPIRQSQALPQQIYPYPRELAEMQRLTRDLKLDKDGKVILPPDLENHPAFQPGKTLQFPQVRYR